MKSNEALKPRLLLVEDNAADVYLIQQALGTAGMNCNIDLIADGDEAFRYIERLDTQNSGNCPDIILLDLNLPGRTGAEVLNRVKTSGRCGTVPIIVLTSSDDPRDREAVEKLGVLHYFIKPSDLDEFLALGPVLKEIYESTR